jgi:hemerythrin
MTSKLNSHSIIWKSEYKIDNFQIDQEHKKLFEIANDAINISRLQNNNEVKIKLRNIITTLLEYVETHFLNEQKHMEDIEYPDLEKHKFIHKNFLKMLSILISKLDTLELQEIENSLSTFINEYFIRHITLEDKKIHLWETSISELKRNFGWKEIYSIDNANIDMEHKKLFDIAKEAFEEVEPILRLIKVRDVLSELYNYMKTHFMHEEMYMQEINYPLIKEHRILHHEIIDRINNFVKQLPTMKDAIFEKELAKIIEISLVNHIIQEDRKIITWLKSNSEI